ncbi:MAG: DUF115 domain-containing protein [Verrucomicrobia bacterium]|nr:DUF115 domain-containing protein [Verrucomicrobiota bacterium]
MSLIPTVAFLAAYATPKTAPPFPQGGSWYASLPKNEVMAIFGYSSEVLAAIPPGQKVLFFEEDIDVIAGAEECNIHLLQEDPEPLFYHIANTYLLQGISVACLPRCSHLKKRAFELEHIFEMNQHLYEEHLDGASLFCSNFFSNLHHLPSAYLASAFYKKFQNVPAVICGAGPSLHKHDLSLLRQRGLILAGGTAIEQVGELAHAGAALDPNYTQTEMLRKSRHFSLPLFYRGRLHSQVLKMWQGPALYTGGAGGYPMADYFDQELLGVPQPIVEEGFNVICYLTSIAVHLGCNPILFVGMDLSYEGKTQWKWLSEGQWIDRFAKRHPQISFINCTQGGMGIGTLLNRPLLEVLPEKAYDLQGRFFSHLRPSGVTPEDIKKAVEAFRASLRRCYVLVQKQKNALTEVELDMEIAYRYHLNLLAHTYERIGQSEKLKRAVEVCLKSML